MPPQLPRARRLHQPPAPCLSLRCQPACSALPVDGAPAPVRPEGCCIAAHRAVGTYAVSLGQEAVSVGIASAMRDDDVLLPSYRDNGGLLWRGVRLKEIMMF
ncbi:thiamine pyrophosphate-dependent enzyme [Bradyrhizobium zhanjiangense]|uniref:thiamine pyrophosphate-dependent enzyme n=1 Tax=Bradyrhizobium zhanjiangense TaxID=1325107 RepID=UPI001FDEC933|nr:thiamine pyrophosphate-dependent enzyme [Bradyrhizobium zhanjiangense]